MRQVKLEHITETVKTLSKWIKQRLLVLNLKGTHIYTYVARSALMIQITKHSREPLKITWGNHVLIHLAHEVIIYIHIRIHIQNNVQSIQWAIHPNRPCTCREKGRKKGVRKREKEAWKEGNDWQNLILL